MNSFTEEFKRILKRSKEFADNLDRFGDKSYSGNSRSSFIHIDLQTDNIYSYEKSGRSADQMIIVMIVNPEMTYADVAAAIRSETFSEVIKLWDEGDLDGAWELAKKLGATKRRLH